MSTKIFSFILVLAACLWAQKIIPSETPVTYISPDALNTKEFVDFFYRYPPTMTLPPGTTVQEYSVWECCLSEPIEANLFIRDKRPEDFWTFPGYRQEDLFCCFIDRALRHYEMWVMESRILDKELEQRRKSRPFTQKMDTVFCNPYPPF